MFALIQYLINNQGYISQIKQKTKAHTARTAIRSSAIYQFFTALRIQHVIETIFIQRDIQNKNS